MGFRNEVSIKWREHKPENSMIKQIEEIIYLFIYSTIFKALTLVVLPNNYKASWERQIVKLINVIQQNTRWSLQYREIESAVGWLDVGITWEFLIGKEPCKIDLNICIGNCNLKKRRGHENNVVTGINCSFEKMLVIAKFTID